MDPLIIGPLVTGGIQLITTWMRNRAQVRTVEKTLSFQEWLHNDQKRSQIDQFEANKQFQREMALARYQEQLDLAARQRQAALDSIEWKATLKSFPLKTPPSQVLEFYAYFTKREEPMPLLVIVSPPEVRADRFVDTTSPLPSSELTILEVVRNFVAQYHDAQHPIKFLAGGWNSKRYHSEAAYEVLFTKLGAVPTLVVESELDGRFFNLRVAFWDVGQLAPAVSSVISRLDCESFLFEAARSDARQWAKVRERYRKRGLAEDEILERGGDAERNRRILVEEEIDRSEGIVRPRTYHVGVKQWEQLFHQIGMAHALVVGCLADVYHLQNRTVMPRLPALLPGWGGGDALNPEVARFLGACYELIFRSLADSVPGWMPDLYMDLALGFAAMGQPAQTSRFLFLTLRYWLFLRGLACDEEETLTGGEGEEGLINCVLARCGIKDRPLVRGMHECMKTIGEQRVLAKLNERLESWRRLLATGDLEEDEKGEVITTF